MKKYSNIAELRPVLLDLINKSCKRNVMVKFGGKFTTMSIPKFLQEAMKTPSVAWNFDAQLLRASIADISLEIESAAKEALQNQNRSIYILTLNLTPNESFEYLDEVTGEIYNMEADDTGTLVFYVGETTISVKERFRQHKVWTKKQQQVGAKSHKNRLLYRFTSVYSNFTCHTICTDGTLSEADVMATVQNMGFTLLNSKKCNEKRALIG